MTFLVLDGNSLLHRAFYGVKALTTKDGRYTNAIVGFLNITLRLWEKTDATHAAAAFDLPSLTFRHRQYAAYKAGRRPMPDELREQLPVVKELLPLLGVPVVTCEGYEADDILGTLSAACEAQEADCFLATGDRDALQLIGPRTTVLLASTRAGQPELVEMDEAAVKEKYGLSPAQLIDVKALMGDTSDNIPGVPGVGEKTALPLIQQYGSLDALFEALPGSPLRESLKVKLTEGKDSAYLSRQLGTICRSAPIDTSLSSYQIRPMQKDALSRRLTDLECFRLIEKLGLTVAEAPAPQRESRAARIVSGEELPLALKGKAPLDIVRGEKWYAGKSGILAELDDLRPLRDRLADPDCPKRTNDAKRLCAEALELRCVPQGITMDSSLAGYLLDPLSPDYSLPRLLSVYGICGQSGKSEAYFGALCDVLERDIDQKGQRALLRDIELPLALVLSDMERIGIEVDGQGITLYGNQLDREIDALKHGVWDAVGYEFNLNSPKQLAKALFDDLGLPPGKKTKSGYSTNADVLEKLRTVHPAVDMLLRYRTLSKLRSTYCEGLVKEIGPDGRIHTTFNQTETRTGRISSAEPNLQNIPVRQEVGRQLRRFFRAKEGCVLVDADYSQIELRVLAHMSGDPTMIAAFQSGEDIHRITASKVFGVPPEMVTPLMRSRAKAVNFGIIYGIGAHSLSQDIGVSYREANATIEEYLHHYGAVASFMDGLIAKARELGYAETLFGRRRPLPELKAGNAVTRGFGERVARNMPIQGTAADIIKMAMNRVWDRLRREGLQSKLILQVHDELMVEAPFSEQRRVETLLKEEMEGAVSLRVPLTVDVHSGRTWFEAKE